MNKYIKIILILLLGLRSVAQNVSIESGAIFTVTGNTLVSTGNSITNSGLISNSGTLALGADWTNNGTYQTNAGTVILNGLTTQNISHNGNTFDTLIISSTSEKIFTSDVFINNKLYLNSGIVKVNTGNYFTLKSTAVTTSGNVNSFVDGKLYWVGDGTKYFPVGKNTIFAPVQLTQMTGNNSSVGMEVIMPNTYTSFDNTLLSVTDRQYWELDENGNNISAKIVLASDDYYLITDTANLVVAQIDSLTGIFTNIGKDTINYTIPFNGVRSLNQINSKIFTIALRNVSNADLLFIPNSLSPYALNVEDQVVKIYGNLLLPDNFSFKIYNKWGNMVFESNDVLFMSSTGWDGKNKSGTIETAGVYSYILKGKLLNGKNINKVGSITILR